MSGGLVTIAGAACGVAFILGFVGVGVFLIYRSLQSRKRAEASQGWPSTVRQIGESRVTHSTHTDSEGDTSDSYAPYVEYTYQVAGQTFTGRDLTFGFKQGYGNASKAQAVLVNYPVGAQVSVYYDPDDPQQAVLERDAGRSRARDQFWRFGRWCLRRRSAHRQHLVIQCRYRGQRPGQL